MLNNFIYAKEKSLFLEQLEAGNILDEAIVFIEDTKEIWNHGTYFATTEIDPEVFNEIQTKVAELEVNKLDKTEASSTYATKEEVPTKTSELTNDSDFITASTVSGNYATKEELNEVDEKVNVNSQNIEAEVDRAIEVEAALEARIEAHEATTTQAAQDASEANAYAQQAYSRSTEAINTANTAKNAVATLEGLANTDTAQTILAATVTQIEQNTTDVDTLKTMHVFMTEAEFEALAIKDPDKIYMLYEE